MPGHRCGTCHNKTVLNNAFAVEGDTIFCTPECWEIHMDELRYIEMTRRNEGFAMVESLVDDYDEETVE